MDSTAKPTPAGADDPLLARDDTKANSDYERVVREELARVQERLAQLASAGKSAAASTEVKIVPAASDATGSSANNLDANVTAFRAADISAIEGGRFSRKRGATRFLTGVLLAGTIVGAGAAWASYGDAVKPLVASWMPQINDTWSQVSERLGLTREQSAAAAPTATDATAPPATPPEVTASQAVAPPTPAPAAAPAPAVVTVAAPASGDVGQMLQDMARDIAGLQQGIQQLKAGQEQMARDNAKLAEQLKASQEQLTRVMARVSEQSLHPRPPLPAPPKPLATAARRPVPAPVSTLPPPQAIAPPPQAAAAPAQLQADDTSSPSAPRPPKPVP